MPATLRKANLEGGNTAERFFPGFLRPNSASKPGALPLSFGFAALDSLSALYSTPQGVKSCVQDRFWKDRENR
jgi:hypothetical protein